MKIIVKLFGTLAQEFPGYNHEEGMDIELPDGSEVKDLLSHLEISKFRENVVVMKGRVVKPSDALEKGCLIQIFQSVFGG